MFRKRGKREGERERTTHPGPLASRKRTSNTNPQTDNPKTTQQPQNTHQQQRKATDTRTQNKFRRSNTLLISVAIPSPRVHWWKRAAPDNNVHSM